jgi:cytoskeletal protein RodZ
MPVTVTDRSAAADRTVASRRWSRKFFAGVAVAAVVAVVMPTGVAFAAQPGSIAAVPESAPKPDPKVESESEPKVAAEKSAKNSTKATAPSAEAKPDTPKDPAVANEQQARSQAAADQAAKDAVAEQQARAQAAAEARAAKLAAAGQRSKAAWDGHGRPSKMIVVRTRSIDLVTGGRLTRQVPRSGGALTLSTLDRFVPDDWLRIADGTANLSAAIVMTPLTGLNLGGDVKTLKLAGGPDPSDAASIYTGRGKLTARDITVTSADSGFQQALPPGPGRPFIVVSVGGRFEATDATISDLGTVPTDPADRAGVTFGEGSSGAVVRTSMLRNSIGIKVDRANNIRLEAVTVSESASDGLVLRGDRGTALIGITAERNGGNGVLVTGPSSDRPISGITAQGNKLFGVAVLGQTKPRITGISTNGDTVGGLRISWSTEVNVTDFTSVDDPIGVYTHVGSGQVVIDRMKVTGARRGLQIEKTTRDLELNDSTIDNASIAGVSIGGHEVQLNRVTVNDSGTGMRVERGASEVTVDGLTLTGGRDGIVALSATKNVVLKNVVADGVAGDAIRTFSPAAQILGGRITGSSTGIDTGAATSINGTAITEVDTGVRARTGEVVRIDGIQVSALSAGINAAAGSPVIVTDSRLDALQAVRGVVQLQGATNQLSLPPLNLLGAIGVPLILLALLLEQVQAFRQRSIGIGVRRRLPPNPAQVA